MPSLPREQLEKWVEEWLEANREAERKGDWRGLADFFADDATYGYSARGFLLQAYPTNLDAIRKGLLCSFPNLEIRYNQAISDADQNDYFVR